MIDKKSSEQTVENPSISAPRKKIAVWLILIGVMIDTTGLGIIIPIFPQLLQELLQTNISNITIYAGFLMFTFSLMQFLCSPIMGSLSDQFGRRPVLLISLFGLAIDYIILAVAPNILWFFIGRLIAGIMGASQATAMAYVADISNPTSMPKNFGLVQAAIGLGFVIGPLAGGILGQYGTRVPFITSAVLVFVSFLFSYFLLPESLPPEKRSKFEFKTLNPLLLAFYFLKYPKFFWIMLIYFVIHLGESVFPSIWTFYVIEKFSWSPAIIGYSLGVFGLAVLLVQSLLVHPTIKWLGQKRTVLYGFLILVVGYILCGVVPKGWMLVLNSFVIEIGWISVTAFVSITTSLVAKDENGKLQGVLASLTSLSMIIGPLVMTQLFAAFSDRETSYYFPGMPFLLSALLSLMGFGFCFFWLKDYQNRD